MMLLFAPLVAFAGGDAVKRAEWQRVPAAELVEIAGHPLDPEALISLGRLRDPDALPVLSAAVHDSDPAIARAAAFALGLTPGGRGAIREALARTPLAVDVEGRQLAEHGPRWHLLEALGRQGTVADRALLVDLLRAPWPDDEAAARAFLRLHRRGLDVQAARAPLIDALDGDSRTAITAAQALQRIGLGPLDPTTTDRVVHHARSQPSTVSRAALVTALSRSLSGDARRVLLRRAMSDRPLVQVAVLQALAAEAFAGSEALVQQGLSSSDHRVRTAARAISDDEPQTVDPELLIERALDPHAAPAQRSEAVVQLARQQPSTREWVRLLASPDPAVRAAALDELPAAGRRDLVEEVVLTLRVEQDLTAVRIGLGVLRRWGGVVQRSRHLDTVLRRHARSANPAVRRRARDLAAALGLEVSQDPPSAERTERIDPDGVVTTLVGGLPLASEAHRYTRAIVHTSRGDLTLALEPDVAPLAVHTFATLARDGFYDGLLWHRVVPGFVAQTGCPRGDGWGGSGTELPDEVSDRAFRWGAMGFARAERDTGSSQIFVTLGPARFLDGDYTWFGRVVDGMDVAVDLRIGDRIERITVEVAE